MSTAFASALENAKSLGRAGFTSMPEVTAQINNELAVISACTECLYTAVNDGDDPPEKYEKAEQCHVDIAAAVERIARLTRALSGVA